MIEQVSRHIVTVEVLVDTSDPAVAEVLATQLLQHGADALQDVRVALAKIVDVRRPAGSIDEAFSDGLIQ